MAKKKRRGSTKKKVSDTKPTRRSTAKRVSRAAPPRARRATRATAAAGEIRLTYPQVHIRVSEVVGEAAGRDPGDVMPEWVLREAPLRFSDAGVKGLTAPLNDKFADVEVHLTIAQVGDEESVKTVEDLTDLVWDEMPDNHKVGP